MPAAIFGPPYVALSLILCGELCFSSLSVQYFLQLWIYSKCAMLPTLVSSLCF